MSPAPRFDRAAGLGLRLALLLALPLPAALARQTLTPRGSEFRVNQGTGFNQFWCRAACDDHGSNWAFSFSGGLDPYLRVFDYDGLPQTGDVWCTPTLNQYTQDEAEVAIDRIDGRILVAWSERNGYDGELMGIFGRLFDPQGNPITAEFQINQVWPASQWRPLIVPRPVGGFVVAWSGDWDGDCYFRLLDSSGGFLSGDIPMNGYTLGAQADLAPAVAPDGSLFMVYVDYSGHGGAGSGLNLWGRSFDVAGSPIQASEFPLTSPAFSDGDQREPRVAGDGLGRFLVCWEDALHDGSSWGIVARAFDAAGAPLGAEFIVNSTTASVQRNPRVAADSQGRFVVTWEDWSSGSAEIRARWFAADSTPFGPDFVVNASTAGDQIRPSLALSASGADLVVCWEGPGVSLDCFAQFFSTYSPPANYCTAKTNSQGCVPTISAQGRPDFSGPDDLALRSDLLLNNKPGLLFHGLTAASLPFGGGFLCVQPPLVRMPVQNTLGNPPPDDCSGAAVSPLTHAYMTSVGLLPGAQLYAQFWSRDPGFSAPGNMSLTDAIVLELVP